MSTRMWWSIIAFLLIVIAVLAWLLFATPAASPTASVPEDWSATSTKPTDSGSSTQPLDTRVTVTSPRSGATVGHTLTISGKAPNQWYFEASFPIKVTTPEGDTIGTSHGQAQTDWMKPGQVPFTATVTLTLSYSGPATIALLKDNPSGLPENDDSFEVPVIVQ